MFFDSVLHTFNVKLTYFCTMDIQFVLMLILFIAALGYVARMVYRSIHTKSGACNTGCGKCAANFDNIPSPKK